MCSHVVFSKFNLGAFYAVNAENSEQPALRIFRPFIRADGRNLCSDFGIESALGSNSPQLEDNRLPSRSRYFADSLDAFRVSAANDLYRYIWGNVRHFIDHLLNHPGGGYPASKSA